MLTRKEETDLAHRSRNGDAQAADRLIASHLRFVVKIAKFYGNFGLPLGDLIQEGTIGLIQAVQRFNPERNARLSTYAGWWIRAAIQDHVFRSFSLVRLGTTSAHKALFLKLRKLATEFREGVDGLGEEWLDSLSKRFGLPVDEVVRVARRMVGRDVSLNSRAVRDGWEEWLDRLPDDRPGPETALAEDSERRRWRGLIGWALSMLPPRERLIIQKRYLVEVRATRNAIGAELNLSKERVRQLEEQALHTLKELLRPVRDSVQGSGGPLLP